MKNLVAILIILTLASCHSRKPVSRENWTIQIPSNWQVSKRNTEYQMTYPNAPGVLQISSHPYFKTEAGLKSHIKNWPDKFIEKQEAVKQKEEKVRLGNATGRYIEYTGKDNSNWLSWWLQNGTEFVVITYVSKSPILNDEKILINDIIQTIKIEKKH